MVTCYLTCVCNVFGIIYNSQSCISVNYTLTVDVDLKLSISLVDFNKFSAVIIYFIIYRPGKKYDDLKKNLHLFLIGAQ